MTWAEFTKHLLKRKFRYAYPDDKGVWHGTDILFPGDNIGKLVMGIPYNGPFCNNRCCDCYTTSGPDDF